MVLCPHCKAEQVDTSKFCSECGAVIAPGQTATVTHGLRGRFADGDDSSAPSDSSHHGRFLPGTKVAGRYRIVSLVGKGGMGEVYRADDLKLGHTVALKFLPSDFAQDPRRVEYFHAEVRLTRQISHPNVCRVYDIGEMDGLHFLTMEYVDGEDLKSLLRRIGRLPKQKGVEISQQLCAGLAAAHEIGVLHRDLKPANIMLDGKGHVRITDFGLATMASDQPHAEIAGTPAYMAPEQLREGKTTVQSDLYSLGLVLYELFTGEAVHQARSIPEMMRTLDESSPSHPSRVVEDMDPVVESVILKCLAEEPAERPQSARAIAAALPGGDPLNAALATGGTPSPEMVAAAGEAGRMPFSIGAAALVSIALLLVALCFVADRIRLLNLAPMDRSSQSLTDEAKRILTRLQVDIKHKSSAHGFVACDIELEEYEAPEPSDGRGRRFERLRTGPWSGVQFWYRQSHSPLWANHFWPETVGSSGVSANQPGWTRPGMAGVWLSPRGELRQFRRIPPVTVSSLPDPARQELAWSEWFPKETLGFDLNDLSLASWQITPPDAFDQMQTWEGTWPNSDERLYVVAAAYRDQPVFFKVLHPLEKSRLGDRASRKLESSSSQLGVLFFLILIVAIQVGGALLAWWNLCHGRGDHRGALRLSLFVFGAMMTIWILTAQHAGGRQEILSMEIGIAKALFATASCCLSYLAVEPFVRRLRPETLFSSARVLAGRWHDPRVGRDLLAGVAVGVLSKVLAEGSVLASVVLCGESSEYVFAQPGAFQTLAGSAGLIAEIPEAACIGIFWGLGILVLLLLVRLITRREKWAAAIVILLVSIAFTRVLPGVWYVTWFAHLFNTAALVWLVGRLGIFATTVSYFAIGILASPITGDTSAFYFTNGLFLMLLIMAIACYGFYLSVNWRTLDFDART
jgi:serine/threonine-protein kinase